MYFSQMSNAVTLVILLPVSTFILEDKSEQIHSTLQLQWSTDLRTNIYRKFLNITIYRIHIYF